MCGGRADRGAILDKNGDAILNPYYVPDIELITAEKYMNIQTNLQGQQAMDAFLGDRENRDIRIVVAASGEAAVGAASRLEECLSRGDLSYSADQGLLYLEWTIQSKIAGWSPRRQKETEYFVVL